jgi:hypothetical protein
LANTVLFYGKAPLRRVLAPLAQQRDAGEERARREQRGGERLPVLVAPEVRGGGYVPSA